MSNPRLAQRYAKSLIDLATEMKQLEPVYNDMLFFQQITKSSREFVTLLNSPIIHADKKQKIISAIAGDKITSLTDAFIKLLCIKGREDNLSEIINSFISQYQKIKGIHLATLTTAIPVSDAVKSEFETKIKSSAKIDHLILETKVKDDLIGGFVLEMEGKLIDASILRDLNDIKKQFSSNEYIHRLR